MSPEPDTMADWQPQDFGGRLTGSNVRWGLVAIIVTLLAGATGFGYWLYQRPATLQEASATEVSSRATSLEESMPALERFTEELLSQSTESGTTSIFVVESEARALFEASSGLATNQTDLRRASSEAARSALDGVRLATEAHAYHAAVVPVLTPPQLETDPSLIELDEAARAFGEWQLAFDSVRTALPEGVLSEVTERLDLLSSDLNSILTDYVDALREDDTSAARAILSDLSSRLDEINQAMEGSVEGIKTRVATRIEETRQALGQLLDD